MPLYRRPVDTFEDNDDELDNDNQEQETVIVDKDKTWEKRYADLRSYSQKQVNQLTQQVRDLTTQVNAKFTPNFPKTKEDLETWAKKYPDVYGMLKTMIGYDLQEVTADINSRFADIETGKLENEKTAALNTIRARHPDFDELQQPDNPFHAWLATKSVRTQNALYENDTDAQAAIDVIDLYKLETGAPKRGRPSTKDVAREVNINANRTPPSRGRGEYDFSESQINDMSPREFEKHEEAIEDARRNGRLLMDLTGSAR